MALRISELAGLAGVSPDTIRYYEKGGLLPEPAPRRPATPVRRGARRAAALHQGAQSFGLKLTEIKELLEIEDRGEDSTLVEFTFWHDPRGLGRILYPLIRLRQHRNRVAALSSLKRYVEGTARSYGEKDDPTKTPP